MGKTIDRAALHALGALLFYLFFVSALGNIWLAAACALAALPTLGCGTGACSFSRMSRFST